MDALTRYVFANYSHLMTLREGLAYRSVVGTLKAQHYKLAAAQIELQTEWISRDPEVLRLLEHGTEQFYVGVVQRILREQSSEVVLNHCLHCQRLVRTPEAKQCQHCFFSWHDAK